MSDAVQSLETTLGALLHEQGFEFCHGFCADPEAAALFPFERFGKRSTAAFLLANGRAVWPHFERWRALDGDAPHPFDRFVEATVQSACQQAAGQGGGASPRFSIYYAHRVDYATGPGTPTPRGPVPFQRLAALAGFASLGPAYLNAHPKLGPWLSLRAVVVTDIEWDVAPLRAEAPCAGCHAPCKTQLSEALATGLAANTEAGLPYWLAVRAACPIGREHRFDTAMTRYHYLGELSSART